MCDTPMVMVGYSCVGSYHFGGFKIWNFNILVNESLGYKDFVDNFLFLFFLFFFLGGGGGGGSSQNWTSVLKVISMYSF